MKSVEEIAMPLLGKIDEWSKRHEKLVVAIDGHIGAGKTTLLQYLASKRPEILAIPSDDFLMPIEARKKIFRTDPNPVKRMENDGFDFENWKKMIGNFRAEKKAFSFNAFDKASGKKNRPVKYDLNRKILVMEGVLMFHPERTDGLWDRRVYLESDIEEAGARREVRDREFFRKTGKKIPSRKNPHSMAYIFEKVLANYRASHRPAEKADLVIRVD